MLKRSTNNRIINNDVTSISPRNGSILRHGGGGGFGGGIHNTNNPKSVGSFTMGGAICNVVLLVFIIPLVMTGVSVLQSMHSTQQQIINSSSTARFSATDNNNNNNNSPYTINKKSKTTTTTPSNQINIKNTTSNHMLDPLDHLERTPNLLTKEKNKERENKSKYADMNTVEHNADDGEEKENDEEVSKEEENLEEEEEEDPLKQSGTEFVDDDDVDEDDNNQDGDDDEEEEEEEEEEEDFEKEEEVKNDGGYPEEELEIDAGSISDVGTSQGDSTKGRVEEEEEEEEEEDEEEVEDEEQETSTDIKGSKQQTGTSELSSRVKKHTQKPEIVWLASYPNSGTSYTMTLVERGSNRSTASNYGLEVTPPTGSRSIPVHSNHPEGPFWEGYKNAKKMKHTIRDLPDDYVLTKTHCGGRCIKCPATEYVVKNLNDYVAACQRSTSIDETGHATEHVIATSRIKKLVHLIRNPIDNTVSRYHLERKHLIRDDYKLYDSKYPLNYTGFQKWCRDVEKHFSDGKEDIAIPSSTIRSYMKKVPCGGEFYKFAQWHNLLLETIPKLGDDVDDEIPVLTLYYEDYQQHFNQTATKLFEFVLQEVVRPLREFRSLPDYQDHYTSKQLGVIHDLVKRVSSPATWQLVHHYFDRFLEKNPTNVY